MKKLGLAHKMMLVVCLPLLALLFFSGRYVYERYRVEQEMSGVDNMNYMYSLNANNGELKLYVNFDVKTDPNIDQVLTQITSSARSWAFSWLSRRTRSIASWSFFG